MNKINKLILGSIIFGALLSAFIVVFITGPQTQVGASVSQGSDYHATTTSTGRFNPAVSLVQSGNSTLGSVIITGAAAGTIEIYDATTSSVSLRAASMASSTILLASFPASTAAGTYTFDQIAQYGILVSITGTMPTSTITYR